MNLIPRIGPTENIAYSKIEFATAYAQCFTKMPAHAKFEQGPNEIYYVDEFLQERK